MSHGLLHHKVVLVTAAAGTGIGFATAKRSAEEGATVVIADRDERRLNEAAGQLAELTGTRPLAIPCDVTDNKQIAEMVQATLATHGRIDVLVNNAGLGGTLDVVDMTDEVWATVLDVTLTGTMRCMRAVLPSMYALNSGVIVNNSSVLGWRARKGQSHYAAAKAGVNALTRCAAIEAAEHGVRINAVAPSLAMHAHLHQVTSEDLLAQLESSEAFGRSATPEEVANVIIFLASDMSTYMTGEVVSVSSQRAQAEEASSSLGAHGTVLTLVKVVTVLRDAGGKPVAQSILADVDLRTADMV